MWVWNTRELLGSSRARTEFLTFVEAQSYDRIFMQIVAEQGSAGENGFVPIDSRRLGDLVAELRARGAAVYALDGDPYYVLPENHAGVLRTVEALVAHNRESPPSGDSRAYASTSSRTSSLVTKERAARSFSTPGWS